MGVGVVSMAIYRDSPMFIVKKIWFCVDIRYYENLPPGMKIGSFRVKHPKKFHFDCMPIDNYTE